MTSSMSDVERRATPTIRYVLDLHQRMVDIRCFEEAAADLVASGDIKTPCHLYIGQEAVAVGVCSVLEDRDYLLGNHRSHGHFLAKGGRIEPLMAELFCRLDGCSKGRGGSMHVIDLEKGILGTVPMVAGTIPVAAGAALSAQLEGEGRIAVAFFGDSATEEGVFHEALNYAVVHNLPILFVCENNYFSSHLRLERRRPIEELRRLADAVMMPAFRLDGNDVLEVARAAGEAVRRARDGHGPTFIECVTHRWRGHVGPSYDLDVGIRDHGEVEGWMARCPIRAFESQILGLRTAEITESDLDRQWAKARGQVAAAVEAARSSPTPDPATVTDHVFVERAE